MLSGEGLLRIGMGGMILAAAALLTALVLFRISRKRLNHILDEEYGKKRH